MDRRQLTRIFSTLGAVIGPLIFAASNFLISVILQQRSSAEDFGTFAFIQVIAAAGLGISNGIFGVPLVSIFKKATDDRLCRIKSLSAANFAYCLGVGSLAGYLAWNSRQALDVALLAGVFAALSSLRWFFRLQALSELQSKDAFLMDVAFSIVSVGFLLAASLAFELDAKLALLCMIFGSAGSLSLSCLRISEQLRAIFDRGIPFGFDDIRNRGLISLFNSISLEIIATAPAYYLSLRYGPALYAPVATAILLFRPFGVILTALMQFQRPRFARKISESGVSAVSLPLTLTLAASASMLIANLFAIAAFVNFLPDYLYKSGYPPDLLNYAIIILGAAFVAKSAREPIAAVLQAADILIPLAKASAAGATLSLLIILVCLVSNAFSFQLALLATLVGELVALVLVALSHRQVIRD